jgi:hypothetical protein
LSENAIPCLSPLAYAPTRGFKYCSLIAENNNASRYSFVVGWEPRKSLKVFRSELHRPQAD